MKKRVLDWVYGRLVSSRSVLAEKFALAAYGAAYRLGLPLPSLNFNAWPGMPMLETVSWEDVAGVYSGVGEESLAVLLRLFRAARQSRDAAEFVPWDKFLTERERGERHAAMAARLRLGRKSGSLSGAEVAYHHHGLRGIKNAGAYTANKRFIDAGACSGDSALVFLEQYEPAKVCSFEPSEANAAVYRETMARNRIPEGRYELVVKGLSDRQETLRFRDSGDAGNMLGAGEGSVVDVITLDGFCAGGRAEPPVGVIKADVEGMGLKLVKGAEEMIRRDRPILLLAVYHNLDEFLGIYPLLKSWNLGYRFEVRLLHLPCAIGECTLIGIPDALPGGK